MGEKVTTMVLTVNLQCPRCYKEIKKFLCEFPQIRNQVYDEKVNTVTVTVVCCSPEKIRDKLSYRGGKVIESIEIKELPNPEKKKKPDKKEAGKPEVVVVEPENPKPVVGRPNKPKEAPKAKDPEPVTGIPPVLPPMAYYGPSYHGFGGGVPWYSGYGVPTPPQSSYDVNYGYGYPNQYGSRGPNFSRCDDYFSEENPSACSVM
ncbi:uncharacterized protein LOC142542683 [Primulina tabacum]|uniref:uncharacterized protein LOC142542683 n=1 Tax=Primulina tabacum TaxID=48773 RepID=UPI003F5ABF61